MTLIKSISGIRGTIGGKPSINLTPLDIVRFTTAYGQWLSSNSEGTLTVVTGRDARISGPMVHSLVNQTLIGMGINVIDLGLSTTPTVAVAVPWEKANGGIVLTASHNPKEWNALKLLNHKGEFIDAESGEIVLAFAEKQTFNYADVDHLGVLKTNDTYIKKHIDATIAMNTVNVSGIKKGLKLLKFTVFPMEIFLIIQNH